jgi:beta-mannosidase
MRVSLERGFAAATPAGAFADARAIGKSHVSWHEVELPTTAAGALRAHGAWSLDRRRAFDAEDWWWRVPLPDAQRGDVLDFEGVATLWDAWIDGELVAAGDNMFLPRAIELERPGAELVIRCRSIDAELAKKRPRPRWRVPMLEQQQLRWIRTTLLGRTPGWSPPCPPVGPWRPLVLQRGGARVGKVNVSLAVERDIGFVYCGAQLDERVERAALVMRRGGERLEHELALEAGAWVTRASMKQPALWWPHTHGEPALYELSIEAVFSGQTITIDLGSSGFRTVALDRDNADFALRVNGVPVFCRGACWTPLDPVTLRASRDAYAAAVAQARGAGMNMLRVAGAMIYEDDALHDALDAQGVLLWQDLMFANMDYPDDDAFVRGVVLEADYQLGRLAARPSLAIVCGNSEVGQQAAMSGAARELWSPPLFHERLAQVARAAGVAYVASSTDGGAFPHEPRAGCASYYGVGAYLRPLDDARRSEVRFASECLAFANVPSDPALPRVHDPRWKLGSPRDLGAGWDFDDVRDHYVRALYGVDPVALRTVDHERYLALGRAATGEVMTRAFAEWRRGGSVTRGALIWFLRDLRPGAGWGVVDSSGAPKPCWYALKRALAPRAIAITDEGTSGLAIHVVNDAPHVLTSRIDIALWRGDVQVGRGARDVEVPAHGALEIAAASLFEGWLDLSFAYRFGPAAADVMHVALADIGDAFFFPAGLPSTREPDVGLAVDVRDGVLAITTKHFAQTVAIEGKGVIADDNYFHLAPGQTRVVAVPRGSRGTISALNSERTVRFEVPA